MSVSRLEQVWPQWKIDSMIGEGSFGKVYKAVREEHGLTTYSAIKVISIPQNDAELASLRSEGWSEGATNTYLKGIVDDFVNEIKLMESMKGTQNIVSVEDYVVLEKEDRVGWDIFIRMELLTSFIEHTGDKKLTMDEVIKVGLDILGALELCSKMNIIHRDIKPENIFVSSFGYYKLGDFGIARELEKMAGSMSQKGTYNYIAPEVAAGRHYNATVDTYSLGLVLYKLLNNNRLPFFDQTAQVMQYQDRKNAIDRRLRGEPLPPPVGAGHSLAQLILKACAFNPQDRYQSPEEFKQALEMFKAKRTASNFSDLGMSKTVATKPAPTASKPSAKAPVSKPPIADPAPPPVEQFGPKKKKSMKPVIFAVCALLIMGGAFFAWTQFFAANYVNQIIKALESRDYTEAMAIYNENADSINMDALEKALLKRLDNLRDEFRDEAVGYNAAKAELETIREWNIGGLADKLDEVGKYVDDLNDTRLSGKDQEAAMPNLVNKSLSEAEALMKDAGLPYSVTYEIHATIPPNRVIRTEIPAGQIVKKDRAPIEIIVSSGTTATTAPGVVGMSGNNAKLLIENAGLKCELYEDFSDDIAVGMVISQVPAAGNTMPVDGTVTIIVSKGIWYGPIPVPNVSGKTRQEAEALLTANKNFEVSFSEEYHPTVAAGSVISQSPQGGVQAQRKSTVTVIISKGPAPAEDKDNPNSKLYAPMDQREAGSKAIYTRADLEKIGRSADYPMNGKYHLGASIDLADADWAPIGDASNPFTGIFDGRGYVISNMRVSAEQQYVGLFGYANGATIKNVGVEGANINITWTSGSSVYAGGICGYITGSGNIRNCYFTGRVSSVMTAQNGRVYAGGICGLVNTSASVTFCYTAGNVFARTTYSSGNPSTLYAGGICGYNFGSISDCYNAETVTATSTTSNSSGNSNFYAGGICGYNDGNVTKCHNTSEILSSASTSTSPNTRAGGISGYHNSGTISDCYNTGTISASSNAPSAGGICGASRSDILNCRNEGTVAASGSSTSNAGGICGYNDNRKISGCRNMGTVGASGSIYSYVGGICGYNMNGNISDSYNTGAASASANNNDYNSNCSYTGGICGYNNSGVIRNCYNTGTISSISSINSSITYIYSYAGGICGYNSGAGIVSNCYNTGTVSSLSSSNNRSNCDNAYAGGICGYNTSGIISSCYNTGAVSGNGGYSLIRVGGVCGRNEAGIFQNCYWNSDAVQTVYNEDRTLANKIGVGSGSDATTALTSSAMRSQASFVGFDFTVDWIFKDGENNGYPVLRVFY